MIKKRILCLAMAAATVAGVFAVPVSKINAVEKTISQGQLIRNNSFKAGWGAPWVVKNTTDAETKFSVKENAYEVNVINPGTKKTDATLTYSDMKFEKGHNYEISFVVTADNDCKLNAKIAPLSGENVIDEDKEVWAKEFQLKAGEKATITEKFTMNGETVEKLGFQFQLGGETACKYTFETIGIKDDQFKGYTVDYNENGYAVRTNQVGYFTNGEKTAVLVTTSKTPVEWNLLNENNDIVATGMTEVYGNDVDSGDFVHKIDFTNFKLAGKKYKIVVKTDKLVPQFNQLVGQDLNVLAESPRFDIGDNVYSELRYHAFKYFYHNRSAVPIEKQYTDGRDDLAREAGHVKDVAILSAFKGDAWYKDKSKYESLDVTGGWYDAGDHGKYVVNGGISTWTLQNQYERALNAGEDMTKAPYGDGTMNIPESGNKIPDILDESRFNLEFMLKMQVPEGEGNDLAGMVHHKINDESWTGLGMKPSEDEKERYLYPPTTAATLNLAATAAQGARLWGGYDEDFAKKCLVAAEKAWDAAIKNPDIYAPSNPEGGGGAYDDTNVTDEFYWAACELYATTGEQKYLDYMKKSEYYLNVPNSENDEETGAINWANVEALGTMTLLSSKNNLSADEVKKAEANLLSSADTYVGVTNRNGYGVALQNDNYVWASNGNLANIIMVLAYANDVAGNETTKYIDAANKSMDYLLGKNANTQSYVSGFGTNPLRNPHHRFWAHQLDPDKFPLCPRGVLSGGPNAALNDPFVQDVGWSEASRPANAKCFVDHIQSYASNECTINWNAPLAWVASYLDENSNVSPNGNAGEGDPEQKPGTENKPEEGQKPDAGNKPEEGQKPDTENKAEENNNGAVSKKDKVSKTGDVAGLLSLALCGISAGAAVCFKKKK